MTGQYPQCFLYAATCGMCGMISPLLCLLKSQCPIYTPKFLHPEPISWSGVGLLQAIHRKGLTLQISCLSTRCQVNRFVVTATALLIH
ncbi:hypothetical protein GDO81_021871 [Engystomops pustulosus]|uniref:Uncharacterized protein n=1 Tax=Engystomops pustulosus TaxID=76066 RepID=A0AAV6Z5K9_ENGPU|nr:hypothetical protein GDO81_021871 [Engystomops pustulosus]